MATGKCGETGGLFVVMMPVVKRTTSIRRHDIDFGDVNVEWWRPRDRHAPGKRPTTPDHHSPRPPAAWWHCRLYVRDMS